MASRFGHVWTLHGVSYTEQVRNIRDYMAAIWVPEKNVEKIFLGLKKSFSVCKRRPKNMLCASEKTVKKRPKKR